MNTFDADVLIVGGGLVGAALAVALQESGLSVTVLDAQPEVPRADSASWDTRVYALNGASRRLLQRCGAWAQLDATRLQAVQTMQIQGDDGTGLRLEAPEAGLDRLATILESRELLRALRQVAEAAPAIRWLNGEAPARLHVTADAACLTLGDGREWRARLVVGADGAHSWVRQQLGVVPRAHDYRQFGVVANFATAKPHYGTAYQWFFDDGVLAWLPLPGERMSMVWSCAAARKDELLALDAEALAARVASAGGSWLGPLRLLTPAAAFPLRLHHVPQWVAPRVALIGDAAHTVHPLAGQGVNLGFGDVAALAGILQTVPLTRCGDVDVLRRYERARREPVLRMQALCHGLQRLFNNPHPLLRVVRNCGLGLTDQSAWLKRQMIRLADND